MEDTTVENVTNQDIHTVHEFVEKAKHRREVGINYMKIWEEKYLMRKEALAEGKEEGLKLGKEEGLKLGKEEGLKLGRMEGRTEGIKSLIETCQDFNASKEDTILKLIEKFSISQEDAAEYIAKYWKE